MTTFNNGLKNYKIYNSKEITNFFINLEEKYKITNAFEHYNQLVNFSKNKDVPIHEWFKYREGFAGELIDELIDNSNLTKNDMIVDPFVGSGTTLVSGIEKEYESIGIDVNPMSVQIAKVKCTSYSKNDLEDVITELNNLKENVNKIDIVQNEKISKYFNTENYTQLEKIYSYISNIKNENVKDILFCSYLSIIEECSNRKRDGNGLKTVKTSISNVLDYFIKKTNIIINEIKLISNNYKETAHIFNGTAKDIRKYCDIVSKQNNKKIGAIIFSPPYANSFDYFESYKLELWLGGFLNNNSIDKYRNNAVRSFIGCEKEQEADYYVNILAKEIEEAIPEKEKETGKKDSRTRKVPNMIKGYFKDMEEIIKDCYAILRKNGLCYIVIDQSSYLGKIVPSDLLFAYLAEKHGFKVKEIIECRNARTSSQQSKKYPYLKEMLRESIVILEK